jgi:hypothetical protein
MQSTSGAVPMSQLLHQCGTRLLRTSKDRRGKQV